MLSSVSWCICCACGEINCVLALCEFCVLCSPAVALGLLPLRREHDLLDLSAQQPSALDVSAILVHDNVRLPASVVESALPLVHPASGRRIGWLVCYRARLCLLPHHRVLN